MARREVYSDDFDLPKIPPIVMPNIDQPLVREPEAMQPVETASLTSDYAKELAFSEEPVTILLQIPSEKNPAKVIDVYVNGRVEWIPVNTPWTVARKYVEVLARAKPIDISTKHDTPETAPDGNPRNQVLRVTRVLHPFTVIEDKNPRGMEWLRRVMAEG